MNKLIKNFIVILGIVFMPFSGKTQNPIIQTKYTADPAPMVYHDTVFLYTSHDEDNAFGFEMFNWMLYTSTDMVNWTDRGTIASLKTFIWGADNGAWAPQCIFRDGKFYLYCSVAQKSGQMAIGVAVSDSPYGPFIDPLGKPLIANSSDDIDPTAFIDDDGQAYLYWGNPNCYYVKLNQDMISYSGGIVKIDSRPPDYQEGPWFWKRNGHYYLAYASTCCPEGIGYAMSNSPAGPWIHKGKIMDPNSASSGNHPGIIDYKGSSYVFGFNYAILFSQTKIHYERRSICVEKMIYNPDGTIQKVPWWSTTGAPQIGTLNPYIRNEAECIAWESGIETEKNPKTGMYVTDIDDGDYIKVRGIDFGDTGPGIFYASVSSATNGGLIEIRIDSLNGDKIASLPVSYTDGRNNWKLKTTSVVQSTGVHDLFLVFKGDCGKKLFNFDYWKFEKKTSAKKLMAVNASVEKFKIDTVSGMNTLPICVTAIYSDGTSKDASKSALVSYNQDIIKVSKGLITGIRYGLTSLVVSYGDKADTLYILVKDYKSELTVKRIFADTSNMTLFKERTLMITITAEYLDGHTEDITDLAAYESSNPMIATANKGTIKALSNGTATITVGYIDEMGKVSTLPVQIRVTNRNPYIRNKADEFNEQSGIQTENSYNAGGGKNVGYIENGDWIRFNSVDFGNGAGSFQARVSSATNGGNIEIHMDSPNGKAVSSCMVTGTNGWQNWITVTCPVSEVTGIHDVFLKFTGGSGFLLNINWWEFKAK
jgi:arabinoxylan arabinofuranohydrolase